MAALPVLKGVRQGEYCVSFYCLGRQPLNDLHGFYTVCGTYDSQVEAERDAQRLRLSLKSIGGRVKVHLTGHHEGLFGDDAKYQANKKLVSADEQSMFSQKAQEEVEKRRREREEIVEREKQLKLEQELLDDPTNLESYAQLHVSRRMLEESVAAQEHALKSEQKKLEKLRARIAARDTEQPQHAEEWRAFVREKLGNVDSFILRERDGDSAPLDLKEELAKTVAAVAAAEVAATENTGSE